jgi:transaldolase
VEPLIGSDTINTLPPETIDAYRDHGNPAPRLEEDLDGVRVLLDHLAELSIDINAVTDQLEKEGVEKFIKPYDNLMHALEAKRLAALADGGKAA